jgi:hypothetical protein
MATVLAVSMTLLTPGVAHASGGGSTGQGGWTWWDAAIWGGALVGIILFGLVGDIVVGTVIFSVAAAVRGGSALVATARRTIGGWVERDASAPGTDVVAGGRPATSLERR